ncbi:S1-like domain-containing RNA-binding protein [Sporosarcina saromensis]|uniref:S1-like domain-containing RNA-binding protein n=1 Tax=Sporosarcina saromensis TaxID=359365 RepID=A0ABU4GB85_9BACL|nr:S1-like domain-containing RNA-binding protein [Sporosarcina saromensis]MDW0114213.1 S1-like domain-containing RNA-binding protein [Sporosarcina saromensis]
MTTYKPGTIAKLHVKGIEGSRWILDGGDEEIFVNASEFEKPLEEGDAVEVFLYMNRRGELTATANLPNMTCDTFGWARVIRIDEKEGAYVDIGSSFEVLVNKADLPRVKALWPRTDDELYMTLRMDLGGNIFARLATEEKVQELILEAPATVFNRNLQARAYRLLPVGSFFLSTPENYRIFVHHTEREQEPRLGEKVEVRIIDVREDGTLNGSLLPRKEERIGDDAETVYRYLADVGGKMPFTDKSTPDEIKEMFGLSKASFKRALGKLMKEGKVTQNDGWTSLK